jgi:ABC-type transport system involved in multi-copper enzyme maturation permease subunit
MARKTAFLFLFMLLPLYITWIIHGAVGMQEYEYNDYWGGAPLDASPGLLWFQDASFGILFPFLIPLVLAIFATSAIGEEVEGKTLPYLFTRPIYRNWILLTKALGIFLGVFLVAALALVVFWTGSVGLTQSPLEDVGQLLGHLWVLALVVFAAGSLFLLLGVLWRRAIIVIVLYLFVWEFFLSQAPALLFKRVSLVNYARPILLEITDRTPSGDDISLGMVPAGSAHTVLLLLGLGALVAALYVVSNKDYNV